MLTVVDGGATRADSVRPRMAALLHGTEAVLVHDAARALTPEVVFHRVVDALAAGAEAVIPVMPVVDTVKTVEPTTGDGTAIAPELVTGTAPAGVAPGRADAAGLRLRHTAARPRGSRRRSTKPRPPRSRTTPCSWNSWVSPSTPSAVPASR